MPKQPWLDIPGLILHVMARRTEGSDICRCDEDRKKSHIVERGYFAVQT